MTWGLQSPNWGLQPGSPCLSGQWFLIPGSMPGVRASDPPFGILDIRHLRGSGDDKTRVTDWRAGSPATGLLRPGGTRRARFILVGNRWTRWIKVLSTSNPRNSGKKKKKRLGKPGRGILSGVRCRPHKHCESGTLRGQY